MQLPPRLPSPLFSSPPHTTVPFLRASSSSPSPPPKRPRPPCPRSRCCSTGPGTTTTSSIFGRRRAPLVTDGRTDGRTNQPGSESGHQSGLTRVRWGSPGQAKFLLWFWLNNWVVIPFIAICMYGCMYVYKYIVYVCMYVHTAYLYLALIMP